MRIQDHVILVARNAADEFFRFATAVSADRLAWRPLDMGQSVLSMCREIAMTPQWAIDVMEGVQSTEDERKASFAEMQSWDSVAQCRTQFQARFDRWAKYVTGLPDSKLSETRWLPYNGGRDHTYLEMLEYPRWNITYHLGQVAYIQTLYGNRDMY
jgi:uncharacterized damage-inducible protein DinB